MLASFAPIQRVRVMVCVHASRCVPRSISRATSGPPMNTPTSSGIRLNQPAIFSSHENARSKSPCPGQLGAALALKHANPPSKPRMGTPVPTANSTMASASNATPMCSARC